MKGLRDATAEDRSRLSVFFSFFFSFSFFFFSFFNFLFVVVVVVAAVVVVEEYCPSGCKSTDRRPLAAILKRLFFFSQVWSKSGQ